MHFQHHTLLIAALASLAAAIPVKTPEQPSTKGIDINSSEFSQGGCKPILFAWARGSTELGNMGFIVGPQTSEGLKDAFGASAVATEGLEYEASLLDNLEPGGTDAAAAALMRDTLTAMAQECPRAVIVAGGYSQGAAVNHRAIEALPPAVQDRIAGVVLYGDTQAREDGGRIPGFPPQKVMVICQRGDLVCRGVPLVLPFHLTYGTRVDEGVAFLVRKIKDAQAGNGTEEAVFVVEEELEVDGLADGVEKIAVALVA